MEITFLGTGAGMPSKQRNTSSLVISLAAEEEGYWMFDCGEATQHQLLHTPLKPRKINKIFISHLHGDHIFGLPGFLGSRSFLGGDEPLDLYGPKGLQDWLKVTFRLTKTHLSYELNVHEIEEGVIYENENFTVTALELAHVIPSYGFRIEQKPLAGKLLIDQALAEGVPKGPLLQQLKDGEDVELPDGRIVRSADVTGPRQPGFVIAVLGDTSYTEQAVALAKNADVLIHEVTFEEGTEGAKEFGHSTVTEAAEVARKAGVKTLIGNHVSSRYMPSDMKRLLGQGQSIFPNLFIADDLSKYELKNGTIQEITD